MKFQIMLFSGHVKLSAIISLYPDVVLMFPGFDRTYVSILGYFWEVYRHAFPLYLVHSTLQIFKNFQRQKGLSVDPGEAMQLWSRLSHPRNSLACLVFTLL